MERGGERKENAGGETGKGKIKGGENWRGKNHLEMDGCSERCEP